MIVQFNAPTPTPREPVRIFDTPVDVEARIAARRAFVGLKQVYLDATALLDGPEASQLQRAARRARAPGDLLDLQIAVRHALDSHTDRDGDMRRRLDRQALDLYADTGARSLPMPL